LEGSSLLFHNFCFCPTVGECGANSSIGKFSHPCAIREEDIFLAISKFYCLYSGFFDSLHGPIGKDALFFSILENTLNGAIRKSIANYFRKNLHDLFSAVWEVFLDLLILKLKHLKSIRVSSLGCFCFCKVVYNSLVGVSLFHIFVCKVNYQVSIWVGLPPNTVCEHDLFLA
jgi:hypothetical protein